jgi:hypothetical protein
MNGKRGEISHAMIWSNGGSPLGFGGYLKPFGRDKFAIILLFSDFLQAS